MSQEKQRIELLSNWYLKEQLDFDKCLIGFRYQTIKPYLSGPEGLELGSGDGQMTRFLVKDFSRLTIVDGSSILLERIPTFPNLVRICSLFEEFKPDHLFNTIIMDHILEHIEDPVLLLTRVKSWLAQTGKLLIGVPNGNSFHRLVAVKMGLLKHPFELNARDRALGHRRVYHFDQLKNDIEAVGLKVRKVEGIFFKPLSNQQIQDHWTPEMMDGFYELGKDFPEYAAEICAVCEIN